MSGGQMFTEKYDFETALVIVLILAILIVQVSYDKTHFSKKARAGERSKPARVYKKNNPKMQAKRAPPFQPSQLIGWVK